MIFCFERRGFTSDRITKGNQDWHCTRNPTRILGGRCFAIEQVQRIICVCVCLRRAARFCLERRRSTSDQYTRLALPARGNTISGWPLLRNYAVSTNNPWTCLFAPGIMIFASSGAASRVTASRKETKAGTVRATQHEFWVVVASQLSWFSE
jgi:hypothetical protein